MPALHQLVAGFANGDAISNEARVLQKLFRSWGCASEIYCEHKRTLPELRPLARDLARAPAEIGPDDVALLHLSIGSPANELLPTLAGRKVVLYHNITPPAFFRGFNEEIRHHLERGRQQACALAGKVDRALAVSRFNADELVAVGFRDVGVVPLFLDREHWGVAPQRRALAQYDDGKLNVLFVGRCAPNKRLEDLLAAFHYLQRYHEPRSRLLHVGSVAGLERYHALLRAKAVELKLRDVVFAGSVRQDELNACYRASHVFLCMSEHEGFCIPLLEAMAHRVPVLAYAAAAVPETLDGAGVLFREKRHDLVAEMIVRLARDAALRAAVLRAQDERLERYTRTDLAAILRGHLAPLLGGG